MLKIAIIIFRESVEIALILGIILAISGKIKNSRIHILCGVMLGTIGASLFAFFAKMISVSFAGMGDEIFDSIVILLTVLMIIWTIFWMQGYEYKIKKKFGDLSVKINSGLTNQFMLVLVVAATILREATEIILFIYSVSSAESISAEDYLYGLGIGATSGVLVGITIYLGLVRFAGKYIFKISSLMLALIAAGLSARAAGIMTSSGIVLAFSDQAWDSSWLVSDFSFMGKLLNLIAGYSAKPNILQVIFYSSTITLIFLLTRFRTNYKNNITKLEIQND